MGRWAWWAIVYGVAKSRTRPSNNTFTAAPGAVMAELQRDLWLEVSILYVSFSPELPPTLIGRKRNAL